MVYSFYNFVSLKCIKKIVEIYIGQANSKMGLNTNVFQEPRGVMRIIQFIFAIWAFAKTVDYDNHVTLTYCPAKNVSTVIEFGYPFHLDEIHVDLKDCGEKIKLRLLGDFSSDAQFFVATGVLSMLYSVGVSVVYVLFDDMYESKPMLPIVDFSVTLLLAVFWLSGSAAWANGLMGLKSLTDPANIIAWKECKEIDCEASVGSFSGLNISVTLGFLNFFLWAFDLWFLYKETQWFKTPNQTSAARSGVTAA